MKIRNFKSSLISSKNNKIIALKYSNLKAKIFKRIEKIYWTLNWTLYQTTKI